MSVQQLCEKSPKIAEAQRFTRLVKERKALEFAPWLKATAKSSSSKVKTFQLPSYSLDYNPIKKFWKQVEQEVTHLHYFSTFEALTTTAEQALLNFAQAPQAILSSCAVPFALGVVA